MLNTKFQASEPSGSEAEEFFSYFHVYFYGLNLRPLVEAILDPGTLVWTNLVKDH